MALQTCYGKKKKKRESKIRNKDQSFACKHQMKNPVWKKISFEMHATTASEYFVVQLEHGFKIRITGKTGKQETEMKE